MAATLLILPAGCAQKVVDPLAPGIHQPAWPPRPEPARVRYVGSLTGSDNYPDSPSLGQTLRRIVHGPEDPSLLITPQAVAVDAAGGRVAVADTNAHCVHLFDITAKRYQRIDGFNEADGLLRSPVAVTWCDTQLWVADADRGQIAAITINGPGRWLGQGLLQRPAGMAYCPANQLCYVVDAAGHAVVALDKSGNPIHQFGTRGAGPGQFNFPTHVAVSDEGWLAVCDSLNFRIQRFGLDGGFLDQFGRKGDAAGDLALPKGIAIDAKGNVWVADAHFENVQAFTPEGQLLITLGEEGQKPGQFWLPAGLAIDAKQRLWVADTYNRRVQAFEILP